jgi:hypothetical protein
MKSLSMPPVLPQHQPDLTPEHKVAVVEALRLAWSELCRTHTELLLSAKEEIITAELQQLLNRRFNGERVINYLTDFEAVTRGEKKTTIDGRIEKQPDLTFRPFVYSLVTSHSDWGWSVECKIVDGGATVTLYCNEGVRRFTSGEYAAWMPSGAMLAYVRDGSKPAAFLVKKLPGNYGTRRCDLGITDDLCESEHDRSTLPCIDITLTHLWLAVS